MRLLYVITRANHGGAQQQVLSLARAAKARGDLVSVVVGENGWLCDRLREHGIEPVRMSSLHRSWDPMSIARFMWEFRKFLEAHPVEVVHFHSSHTLFGLFATSTMPGGPRSVVTVHGWSILSPGWTQSRAKKLLYKQAMKWLLRYADRVICVSETDLRFGVAEGLLESDRAVIVRNGVAPTMPFESREAARAALGLASSDLVVGCVARLDYPKHLEMILLAARHLKDRPIQWRILGAGPLLGKLEALLRVWELSDRVKIVSDLPDPRRFLPALDLFLLTSRYEGFPYALLEASMAGVPVIAANVGGVGDLIWDGVSGRLVPPGDQVALETAILSWIENQAEGTRQAAVAKDRVLRDYTEDRMIRETLGLYVWDAEADSPHG